MQGQAVSSVPVYVNTCSLDSILGLNDPWAWTSFKSLKQHVPFLDFKNYPVAIKLKSPRKI